MQKSTLLLLVGLAAAIGLALTYGSPGSSAASAPPPPTAQAASPEMGQDMGQEMEQDFGELPPNHPPINMGGGGVAPDDLPPALTWKAPADWSTAPNPNPMRLATYKLPRTAADNEETELIIARAGGDVGTNVARWKSQFDGAFTAKEAHKTVHDLKVTIVQIDGTYTGGMGPSGGRHDGWTMLAAIVETKDQPYFFKVIGPSATVHAAQKPFEAMIDRLSPS